VTARSTTSAVVFAALAVVVACGSSSSTEAPVEVTGACRAIASACHRYDEGAGVAHECHELGHDANDDAVCAKRRDACLAACPPLASSGARDAGTPRDPRDASEGDAGADPCVAYCECLGTTCAALPGYPFATPSDCMGACRALDAERSACFPKFCALARKGVSAAHNCEHSWGKFGLDECETL